MASDVVIKDSGYSGPSSRMAIAFEELAGKIDEKQEGLFGQKATIKCGNVTIKNTELDLEFNVPFDDDTEANESSIVVYNLTSKTINEIKKHKKITITAGYGKDTGIIFSGYVSSKKTRHEGSDKVTTIYALDSEDRKEKKIKSISFNKNTKASAILKKLVNMLGLTVATFKVDRDYVYKDKVTVDGGIMENIKKYAKVCGVSAYISKSKVYVCPLDYKKGSVFNLSSETGLISLSEFEEEEKNEKYKDKYKGYECKMLLANQIHTGSIVKIDTKDVKGTFRVREGVHEYSGNEFTTTVKVIKV